MPELPEVETIRAGLDPLLRGAVVTGAWAFPSSKFTDAPLAIGSRIRQVRRRGKYLLFDLDDSLELVVHLGMTGRLAVTAPDDLREPGPHRRAHWDLDDGRRLEFDDMRRFGRVAVVEAGRHDLLPTLAALGPEPFDEEFSTERLRTMVNRSSRALKTQLLGQRVVAGVGNIYADEALWRARVHPAARRLTRPQSQRVRDAVVEVLTEAVSNGGTTLRDYRTIRGTYGNHQSNLECYGRAGLPCGRCGEPLRRIVVDARSTTFCPTCQRR